jgi:RND family efflux transporter MFP subunit
MDERKQGSPDAKRDDSSGADNSGNEEQGKSDVDAGGNPSQAAKSEDGAQPDAGRQGRSRDGEGAQGNHDGDRSGDTNQRDRKRDTSAQENSSDGEKEDESKKAGDKGQQKSGSSSTDFDSEHAKKPSRFAAVTFGVVVLLLLIGGLGYGAWSAYTRHETTQKVAEHKRNYVPKVRVAEVKASDDTIKVSLPGNTNAFTTADIYARASGYIEKRNVDIGDRVKEGQLLAEIVAPELDHQIQQGQAQLQLYQANLQQSIANRDLAQITWDRDQPLVAKGWTTQQQGSVDQQNLKAQIAAVGVAEQNVRAQEAQLKVLQQQKDYQRVIAPFNGIVTQRNVDIGTLVQADSTTGTFLFTVMQIDTIRTQVYVPQDQAFGLKPGVHAVIKVPEYPNRDFPGTVTRLARALNQQTRTLLTEIDVPNPDGALSPGAYCAVVLSIPRESPALIVPADAVVFDQNGLHVAVVEDGVVQIRPIRISRDFGTSVEAQTGVKKGDLVVMKPAVDLVQGSKVDIGADNKSQQGAKPNS